MSSPSPSPSPSYLDITPDLLELMNKPFCYFCGAPVLIDYSVVDYVDPNTKPIIRNVGDLTSYHTCAAGSAVRDYLHRDNFIQPLVDSQRNS
jgi:hypothetical protein